MAVKKYLDLLGLKHFLDNLRAERPVIELTSAEYEALEQAGEIDPKAFYFITDSDVSGRNPDTEMSSASTNTVQNKVIKAYVDSQKVTVDDSISSRSTNPVQNKVIKAYVDSQKVTVDDSISSGSTNPVQNKVIKAYVDSQISNLRTELVAMIDSITDVVASDTAPTDTSKVWIDTAGA